MVVILLVTTLIVTADSARADDTDKGQGGSKNLGSKMGRFMNSFMEGLEPPAADKNGTKQTVEKKTSRSGRVGLRGSSKNVYDPWQGEYRRRLPSNFYDPWGATGNTQGFTRFADRDWALGRDYYGAGSKPWGRPGYETSPDNRFRDDPSGWNRGYEQDWPPSSTRNPYGRGYYPYGEDRYRSQGRNW